MRPVTHWGIIGTGTIAKKFAETLLTLPDAALVAVGSRSREKAMSFGNQFNVTYRHGSYEELVANPAVDAVYVATPHSCHRDNTLLALRAGKPVLCEKPFALDARQAAEMIACARERKLLLMEAMWTRFLPVMVKLRRLRADGVLGEPRLVTADLGFRAEANAAGRLFDPALGGGALLDVGVYPVALASMIFGAPTEAASLAKLGDAPVDLQEGIVLRHAEGQLSVLHASIEVTTFQEASILGTLGRIKLHSPWWRSTAMTLMRENLKNDFWECPFNGNGYQYEASEFMACLHSGKLESDVMPLNETLSILTTLDSLRLQWGLRYPGEEISQSPPNS